MELGQLYCQQLRQQFTGLHANFPPNRPLALGDYGILKDDVFQRLGNISQQGVSFKVTDGTAESTYSFQSAGSVDVDFVAKGDVSPGGVPAIRASLGIHFTKEQAVFFNAAGCKVSQIDDLKAVGDALIALLGGGNWEADFYVVTNVVNATTTTALASSDSNAEISLEAKSDALEQIDLGDASLSLRIKKARSMALQIVTANGQIPLMQLSRVRGFFEKQFRPEAFEVTPTLETATLVLETAPSAFEVDRAIRAYIPLLQASYALAEAQPIVFPPGYENLGEIRAGTVEESGEVMDPEARQSIENDIRAMQAIPTAPAGTGPELAAVPAPDAFGFVARETATGAILVSIRGTLTPIEWVADFVPVPIPFREVPGFGLVHLGFDLLYKTIRDRVRQLLDPLDDNLRITVVGHSLGAAMATLCVIDIKRNMRKQNVDLATFGSPRTGKIDFRIHFNKEISRCYRVTNHGDIVPSVPSLLTLWNHVGEEIGVRGKFPGAIPHDLRAYLDGLQHISQPQEIAPAGIVHPESVEMSGIRSMRTL